MPVRTTCLDLGHYPGARVLSVQVQRDEIRILAIADAKATTVQRTFVVLNTGDAMPDLALRFWATVQMNGGALVLHVFELDSPEATDTWD